MIHEVMVLDHSGPAFAMILYGGGARNCLSSVRSSPASHSRLSTGIAWLDWPIFVAEMLVAGGDWSALWNRSWPASV